MAERSRTEQIIEALTAQAKQLDEENRRTPLDRRTTISMDELEFRAALVRAAIVGIETVEMGGDGIIHAPHSVTVELAHRDRQSGGTRGNEIDPRRCGSIRIHRAGTGEEWSVPIEDDQN